MYRDTQTWQRTLGAPQDGGTQDEVIEILRSRYEQFRINVARLAGEISKSVPDYTDHSITHCDSLWEMADLLLGPNYPLNPAEAFVLGGSFLIHDLGMGVAAYSGGLQQIYNDPAWLDLLADLHPDSFHDLQNIAQKDLQNNPTWDGLTDLDVKAALTLYLREHHAEHAAKVLFQQWEMTNEEKFYLLEDAELRHWYSDLIGKLGRSHWQDVDLLPELFAQTVGGPPSMSNWTIDPLKLACILRTADAAQIDSRRADPMHTPFRNPQGASLHHWQFQERLPSPQIQQDRLKYASPIDFPLDKAEAWWLAYDTVTAVDKELRTVDALLGDLGRPRLRARSVVGADSPKRFSAFVRPGDWSPVDARPRITNTTSIISRLGGEALYGENKLVPIRELLANGVDATRLLRAAYDDEDTIKPVRLSIKEGDGSYWLEVQDFGIGMTVSEVITYLCDFGRSGWTSHTTRSAYPGALASGYQSTGKFGIGFYSVFMIATEVTVYTRSADVGTRETVVLHFADGLQDRPILRPAHRDERLRDQGTRVVLRLDKEPGTTDGIFHSRSSTDLETRIINAVSSMALMADHAIEVSLWEKPYQRATTIGDRWQDMDSDELVSAIVPASGPWSFEIGAEAISSIAARLSPLRDAEGNTVARLALDIGVQEFPELPYLGAEIYCGGFSAGSLSQVIGIAVGTPERAARDAARVTTGYAELCTWFDEQLALISEVSRLPVDQQATLAQIALEFGRTVEDAAICWSSTGPLSSRMIQDDFAKSHETIMLIDDYYTIVKLPTGAYGLVDRDADEISLIPENAVCMIYTHNAFDLLNDVVRDGVPLETIHNSDQPTTKGSTVGDYWNANASDCTGEVVRAIASSWGLSVSEILLTASWFGTAAEDQHVTLDGSTDPRRYISATRFTKPPAP